MLYKVNRYTSSIVPNQLLHEASIRRTDVCAKFENDISVVVYG